MIFEELSIYFSKLEQTASRNTMTEILAELFSKAEADEIDKICYLMQGRVAPIFEAVEFGMAEKMVMKAIAVAGGVSVNEVDKEFKEVGDLGKVAEKLKVSNKNSPQEFLRNSTGQAKIKNTRLAEATAKRAIQKPKISINEVFEILQKIAMSGGAGSVEIKVNLLANLLKDLDSLSCRFIVRIPIAKMRLGFSDMTILDAMSWMLSKSKKDRKDMEKAYNVRPDLGFIARVVKEKGVTGLLKINPTVGTPILMAKAERLSSGKEIIEKIGRCGVEPKIDGFRLQCHYKRKGFKNQESFDFVPNNKGVQKIRLFTRNLEEVTLMYPDVVEGIEKQILGEEVIFEGEAIGFDPKTKEFLPFQETVQRKRKYDIEKIKKEVPLKLICFELLFKDGENILNKTYKERREELTKIIKPGETLILAKQQEIDNAKDLEENFQKSIALGLEGVMAKKLDGVYQAGMRGWNWIKYKKSYDSKIDDTIDAVVMGYDFGQGKRTGFGIGAFLIGVYDKTADNFKTIAKIGTGLTDIEWRELKVKSENLKVKEKPIRYDIDKMMECNVWVEPKIMVTIKADEITRSPVHTAGREMQKTKGGGGMEVKVSGYALRFPRLVNFREDKAPEDATSVNEIEEMYKMQERK